MNKSCRYYSLLLVWTMSLACCAVEMRAQSDSLYLAMQHQTKAISKSSYFGKEFEPSFGNHLKGKVSGLTVMQSSADPDSNIPTLYVRGVSTFNTSAGALVLIDGFEGDINMLMPEEVEKVEVLKDAAALAVYGIRGANGVVLITTRRGKEEKMRIAINASAGANYPLTMPSFVSAHDYAMLYNEALSNDMGSYTAYYSPEALAAYQTGSDPYLFPNVDWQNAIFQPMTWSEEGNISISTGNKIAKLYAVIGFVNAPKLYKNNIESDLKDVRNLNAYTRYNVRANLDVHINDIFDIKANIGGYIANSNTPNIESDQLFSLVYGLPNNAFPVKNPNGSWAATSRYPDNPMAAMFGMGKRSTHSRSIKTDIDLTQNLDKYVEGLSFREAVSFDGFMSSGYFYQKDVARYQMNMLNGETSYDKVAGNNTEYTINESEAYRRQQTRVAVLTEANYTRSFGNHCFSAMLGGMYSRLIVDGNNVPYLHAGLYGELMYNYANRYYATWGMAYNGSENLKNGNKWGYFPSLSFAWQIANEDFFLHKDVMDNCKLRLSAGMLGNAEWEEARYVYQSYYANCGTLNLGSTATSSISAISMERLSNSEVSYEKNYRLNLGWDARWLRKIDVSADLFYEQRTGVLSTYANTTPSIIGVPLPYYNLGRVDNFGGELTLGYYDHIGDFSWGGNFNISYAQNRILEQDEVMRPESYLYRTGHSVGQFFGLEAIGFFESEEDILHSPKQQFANVQPGDIKYKDQNDDGIINENDEIAIGYSPIPRLTYGLQLFFGWKGLDISMDFDGQAMKSVILSGNTAYAFYRNGQVPEMAMERWAYYPEQGVDTRSTATYPRLSLQENNNNYRSSTQWLRDASFLRLRNVEVGYDFAHLLHKTWPVSRLRWFVSASNLFALSPLREYDAEIMTGYPITANISTGINIELY